jgi:hypothetical protein
MLAVAVVSGIGAYFGAYLKRKGENFATKEDTRAITSLVESVKSEIEFALQAKLSLRSEAHQALVDYFSKFSTFLSAIVNCSFVEIGEDYTRQFAEIRLRLDELFEECSLAAAKMWLFVTNTEIQDQHHRLMKETLQFKHHADTATFQAERVRLELERHPEQYEALFEQRSEHYKKFKEEQTTMYQAIYPLVHEHRATIAAQIRALADG